MPAFGLALGVQYMVGASLISQPQLQDSAGNLLVDSAGNVLVFPPRM